MSVDETKLSPNQINVLVVLMAEAREMNNKDLKELAGFALTGADNKKLVDLGLVETDKSHRPFSHTLTDKGWALVRDLHNAEPPKQGGSATRSLLTLLGNLHRSLDRLQMSEGEFFKQGQEMVDIEPDIRAAYSELAEAPGEWVGLADLRERLTDIDRRTVDKTLRAMVGRNGVRIIPVANTKSLKPRDREAALKIGDEDNHALSIGES